MNDHWTLSHATYDRIVGLDGPPPFYIDVTFDDALPFGKVLSPISDIDFTDAEMTARYGTF